MRGVDPRERDGEIQTQPSLVFAVSSQPIAGWCAGWRVTAQDWMLCCCHPAS